MFRKILATFPNFADFTEKDLDWIISVGKFMEFRAGEIIIQADQVIIDTLYILIEGALKVSVFHAGEVDDGEEIERIYPGGMIGTLSFVDNRPPSSTFKAVENSRVLAIPKYLLLKKMEQDTYFAANFYQTLCVSLSQQLRNLSDFLTRNNVIPGEPLRKVLFVFAILNDGDIDWMIFQGKSQKVTSGTVLIEQGKPVEAVYILLEGTLGIFVATKQGDIVQKEIAKSFKGEILGEMSFVETGIASATVKASENCVLLAIPQSILANKLNEDRGFTARFYRAIAVVLVDRLRDRLFRRGFGNMLSKLDQLLAADIEVEDELNLDILDNTALAGARFDWMIKRLRS
ncbi:cyclic nucleotide-binding protein [Cylindrospermum sp. NIES-4074]|nr:cyclic nucleotide-binding protein [Cylindrospermum sp. NIES-4074]